jgi:hypothetical protein
MYEHHKQKLLTGPEFVARVVRHGILVMIAIAVALGIGIVGYHFTNDLPWIDSLLNASMILGGMGPVNPTTTTAAKLFASFYALFSGLFFIAAAGILVAPFLHRLMHRFHIEEKGTDQ